MPRLLSWQAMEGGHEALARRRYYAFWAAESDSVPSLDNAAPTSLRLKQGCPAGVPAARLQLRFERIERHDVMALIK